MRHPGLLGLLALLLLLGSPIAAQDADKHASDVKLATKTRYARRLPIPGAPSIHALPDLPGYNATALWLLSRHGTRWPTEQRIKQIESLSPTFKDATNTQEYPWLAGWTPPTEGLLSAAGELHSIGEDELWSLGQRLRRRFPNVLRKPYLPRRHPIISTQVPRAAASAFAFAAGFFPGHRSAASSASSSSSAFNSASTAASAATPARATRLLLNQQDRQDRQDQQQQQQQQQQQPQVQQQQSTVPVGVGVSVGAMVGEASSRPQAVAISMSPKLQDPLLRFYDTCPAYSRHMDAIRPWLASWLVEHWASLAPSIAQRLGLPAGRPLGPCEVDAMWTLCQFEAGLQDQPARACALFSSEQLALMEWLDDVELLEAQGWGSELNYRIAAPLLQDLRQTLQVAARSPGGPAPASKLGRSGGVARPYARLLFAHCETLVPLATLLGLFEPELPPVPTPAQSGTASTAINALRRSHTLTRKVDHQQQEQQALEEAEGGRGGEEQEEGPPGRLQEGVDACVSSDPPPTPGVPPPPGWYPRTPRDEGRAFRGGRVSPYGANLALVLYTTTRDAVAGGPLAGAKGGRPVHLVRLLYNEQVLPIPGCTPVMAADSSGDQQQQQQQQQQAGGEHLHHHLDFDLDEFLALTEQAASASLDAMCGDDENHAATA